MISIACSDCGKVFNLSDEKAGKRARCPCGSVFTIPASVPVPRAAPTPIVPSPVPKIAPSNSEFPTVQQIDAGPVKDSKMRVVFNRLKPLLKRRAVRLSLATAACVVVVGGIGFYKLASDRAALQAEILRRSEANYRQGMAGAERLAKQADAEFAEAARLRSRAQGLREEAADDLPAEPRKTRKQAMEDDTLIMSLIDQHPELRREILDGGLTPSASIPLLVSQGRLSMAEARYIQNFKTKISSFPR